MYVVVPTKTKEKNSIIFLKILTNSWKVLYNLVPMIAGSVLSALKGPFYTSFPRFLNAPLEAE